MATRIGRKAERIARCPGRVGVADNLGNFQTRCIKSLDGLVALVKHLEVTIDNQAAEGREEVGAQANGIKLARVDRAHVLDVLKEDAVMADLAGLVVVVDCLVEILVRNTDLFGEFANRACCLKTVALGLQCRLDFFLELSKFCADANDHTDTRVNAAFNHVINLAFIENRPGMMTILRVNDVGSLAEGQRNIFVHETVAVRVDPDGGGLPAGGVKLAGKSDTLALGAQVTDKAHGTALCTFVQPIRE